MRLNLTLKKLDGFAGVSRVLLSHQVEIVSISTEKSKAGHHMELEIRLPNAGQAHTVLTDLEALPGIEVQTVSQGEEA